MGGMLSITFIDLEQDINDNKTVDFSQILPILVADSNEDIIYYDKLNSCFRIIKRYDTEHRAEPVNKNNFY